MCANLHRLAVLLALAAALLACSGDDDDDEGDGDADTDADTDTDGDGDGDGGCASPDAGAGCSLLPDPCLPGRMEIGSGAFSFQELVPGNEEVELIHGPQGGYHVFGGVKVQAVPIDPGVTLLFHFRPVDTCTDIMLPKAKTPIQVGENAFRNAGDGWLATYGYFVILDTTMPDDLNGNRYVLGVEMTDAAGDVYRDEAEVVVNWPGD
jgi:hypothetical protein